MYKVKVDHAKLGRERIIQGMTLNQLAKKSGINRQTLANIESGIANPRPETAQAIAEALSADFEQLFQIYEG